MKCFTNYIIQGGLTLPSKTKKINKQNEKKAGQISLFELDSNSNSNTLNDYDIDSLDLDLVFNWIENRPCQIEKVIASIK